MLNEHINFFQLFLLILIFCNHPSYTLNFLFLVLFMIFKTTTCKVRVDKNKSL